MCQSPANLLHSIKGAGQFGLPGPQSIGARINTVEDAQKIIDVFTSRGYRQIDTSRIYGGGTSEEVRAGFPPRPPSLLISTIADNQPT
jgi:aryl-alcohol dehydrogenase-like predicted oxidoreductase